MREALHTNSHRLQAVYAASESGVSTSLASENWDRDMHKSKPRFLLGCSEQAAVEYIHRFRSRNGLYHAQGSTQEERSAEIVADEFGLAMRNKTEMNVNEVRAPSVIFCRVLLLDSLKVHKMGSVRTKIEEAMMDRAAFCTF
eukprot:jgi/Phyca11/12595/fgenesh1_pg.PHYCAscaffold_1_\